VRILSPEALQSYNSLALEAQATALVRIDSAGQIPEALAWAANRQLPVVPLGAGSNVVFAGDLDLMLLKLETTGIDVLEQRGNSILLRVAAGENWHRLVQWSLGQGYFGLENLALIPGTVGAAPIQNIGAYGVELATFVSSIHGLRLDDGSPITLSREQCEFGYRDSVFKRQLTDQVLITEVDLQLSLTAELETRYPALARQLAISGTGDLTPQAVFDAVVAIRSSKLPDPARIPNAGSFFKNPVADVAQALELANSFPALPRYPQPDGSVKLPAAWFIDQCGWKGYNRDGLGVHPEHALVLVNYGCNSGKQLLELAAAIAESVQANFGIALEIEPRVYGA